MRKQNKLFSLILVCGVLLTLLWTAGCQTEPVMKTFLGKWVDNHDLVWDFQKGGTLLMVQPGEKPITNQAHFEVLDELSFRMTVYPGLENEIVRKVRYTLDGDTLTLKMEKMGETSGATIVLHREGSTVALKAAQPVKKGAKQLGLFRQTLRIHYADVYLASVFMRAVFKQVNSLPHSQ